MYLSIALLIFGGVGTRYRRAANASVTAGENAGASSIKIAKCCEMGEFMMDNRCAPLSEINETRPWRPEFVNAETDEPYKGELNFRFRIGLPRCENNEHQWHVYYGDPASTDRLAFLPSGKLRHYVVHWPNGVQQEREVYEADVDDPDDGETVHYDYALGDYCAERVIPGKDRFVPIYAMICVPEVTVSWTDTNYLMPRVVNPTFRAAAMVCYLVVATVYFVLPQLRNLVGNMITSIALCMTASQCASLVRIFTEFGNHVSFLVADAVTYISLVSAFFWLNALGYYVWNTFRSRNVFLRSTDGRKYCYYSTYVWGSTICIAATAIFAHFTLETEKPTIGGTSYGPQETIGWLALSILFTSVAITVIADLCFVLTTLNTIKGMRSYGRIHHRMKYSFKMFVFLFIIMSVTWLFTLLSQLRYEALTYSYIVVNLLQALCVLYICVFGQKRVTFLLGKTCNCCQSNDASEGLDWGEEMTAMNAGY